MFRRQMFLVLACVSLVFGTAVATVAQSGELRGHVEMTQADGKKVPVGEAFVDVYRVDLPGKYNTKTKKNGTFVFAGLPFVGTYTVVISHPTSTPTWLDGVKAGRNVDYAFELKPGDGKRPTIEEVKAASAASGSAATAPAGAKESAEERAKREELLRKNEEIKAGNEKIEASNAVIQKAFQAGNAAVQAKNYDEAITQYDAGLTAAPDHPGVPSILTNKSIALRSRGVDRYNSALKSSDDAAKTSGIANAKKDWKDAADASSKAVTTLKAQSVPTDPGQAENYKKNLYFALQARSDAMQYYVKHADPTQVDAGATAMEEYIAAETDPVKKAKAEKQLAQLLFDANALDRAQVEYQKLIAKDANDVDAIANMGLILFNVGSNLELSGKKEEAKVKYQEAANFLQQFVDKAPDTHALKAGAKDVLENLKTQQDVKPEKGVNPTRRRGRG